MLMYMCDAQLLNVDDLSTVKPWYVYVYNFGLFYGLSLLCVLNVTLLLYKPTPIVLQNARSRRSVTDHSHTRSTEVEHVHVHFHVHAPGTGIEDVIVTDPEVGHATEAGHAIEAGHATEADHAIEAGRVTETVTVAVGRTGINVVAAEAGVVTVIAESVTVCVSLTTRIGKGFLPRLLGELPLDWSLLQFKFFSHWRADAFSGCFVKCSRT